MKLAPETPISGTNVLKNRKCPRYGLVWGQTVSVLVLAPSTLKPHIVEGAASKACDKMTARRPKMSQPQYRASRTTATELKRNSRPGHLLPKRSNKFCYVPNETIWTQSIFITESMQTDIRHPIKKINCLCPFQSILAPGQWKASDCNPGWSLGIYV